LLLFLLFAALHLDVLHVFVLGFFMPLAKYLSHINFKHIVCMPKQP